MSIAEKVRELIEAKVIETGYDLWDVVYAKEAGEWNLSVIIDKDTEEGIGIDDCIKVNDVIEPIIDAADPIEEAYCLEVASAGLERTLRTPEHYEYALKKQVKVQLKLYKAMNGTKEITGVITDISVGEKNAVVLTVENEQEKYCVERSNIAKAKQVYDM